ncbi:MAG: glucose-6-phosphate isomerase [Nitrospiria bacterium]
MIDIECTTADLGGFDAAVREKLVDFEKARVIQRLWQKDATLWKSDPAVQQKIKNRLGWLGIADEMRVRLEEVTAFAEAVKADGFRHVLLLGMGGSSLCPEVLKQTFGAAPGFPALTVLDTTDPETILTAERAVDLKNTLFLVASKSGGTIEMLSLYHYFSEKVRAFRGDAFGAQFVALTDPGSPLEKLAGENRFRKVFLTPPDVGGRYAALTYFGLVPAALLGMSLSAFMRRASAMIAASSASVSPQASPPVLLGAMLGGLGLAGRDKVTFITSPSLAHFGIWAEQLVAESTGKEGKGLIPVDGEVPGAPEVYGDDRFFVCLRLDADSNVVLDERLAALQKAGHPVVQIDLQDKLDLAGEFFRWEMATAVAGVVLAVNPFDEPNVSESKANTAKVLADFEATGVLTLPDGTAVADSIVVAGDVQPGETAGLSRMLQDFLGQSGPGDYVAIMAYLSPKKENDALLQALRTRIREKYGLATTLGYGPRFLHSTGQLHKGGARRGRFIQITIDDEEDMPVPGVPYSFGVLKRAQALGDFHSLQRHQLPVMDIRLGKAVEAGLKRVVEIVGGFPVRAFG